MPRKRHKLLRLYATPADRKLTVKGEPIVLFVTGPTGSGKTTMSKILAEKLGISTILNTSFIREIQRAYLCNDPKSVLHTSSYLQSNDGKTIPGYLEQAEVVRGGIKAVLRRVHLKGIPAIIEGVHILPSMWTGEPSYFAAVLDVPPEEQHVQNLKEREGTIKYNVPAKKYIEKLQAIREIGKYIVGDAKATGGNSIIILSTGEIERNASKVVRIVLQRIAEQV